MVYISTRGGASAGAAEAVLRGIAADGGLFVDPMLAQEPFDWRRCLTLDALGIQTMLLKHLLPDIDGMDELCRRAYDGKFETDELTPLVRVGEDYVLELFHGPTSAFKDVALSMLPQLVTAARTQRGERGECVVLTATSGDTGKAARHGQGRARGLSRRSGHAHLRLLSPRRRQCDPARPDGHAGGKKRHGLRRARQL